MGGTSSSCCGTCGEITPNTFVTLFEKKKGGSGVRGQMGERQVHRGGTKPERNLAIDTFLLQEREMEAKIPGIPQRDVPAGRSRFWSRRVILLVVEFEKKRKLPKSNNDNKKNAGVQLGLRPTLPHSSEEARDQQTCPLWYFSSC